MFQSIHFKTAASRLLAKSQASVKSTQPKQKAGSYFSNVIDSVSTAKTATSSSTSSAAASATGAAKISSRQNIASAKTSPPVTDAVITSKTATATASGDTTSTTPTPVDVLNSALEAAGLIPSQFKVESHEEWVVYPGPGGGYMHRYTNVQLPNGKQENFSTDLMARYPDITVNEIKRILRIGNGDPNSGLF